MRCAPLLAVLLAIVDSAAKVTAERTAPLGQVILIRHGEKPPHGDGLTEAGEERAQCLVEFFGAGRNETTRPKHIWAQQINSHQTSRRPLETVTPLAHYLNLTVDQTYARDDYSGVAAAIIAEATTYPGDDWVGLVCWEHKALTGVAAALGVLAPPTYPGDGFDQTWTINLTLPSRPLVIGAEGCTFPGPPGSPLPGWAVALIVAACLAAVGSALVVLRRWRMRRTARTARRAGAHYDEF